MFYNYLKYREVTWPSKSTLTSHRKGIEAPLVDTRRKINNICSAASRT